MLLLMIMQIDRKGVLVQCDPSIKSIIMDIDTKEDHAFVVEELDDQNLVVKESMLQVLKKRLDDVGSCCCHQVVWQG